MPSLITPQRFVLELPEAAGEIGAEPFVFQVMRAQVQRPVVMPPLWRCSRCLREWRYPTRPLECGFCAHAATHHTLYRPLPPPLSEA